MSAAKNPEMNETWKRITSKKPWDLSLPLATTLQERSHFGHGYKNESLETKRRRAIQWLRTASKTGWIMDRTIRFIQGETR